MDHFDLLVLNKSASVRASQALSRHQALQKKDIMWVKLTDIEP